MRLELCVSPVCLPLLIDKEQCEVVGLGHRELLPCLVALLLPPLGAVEDGGDREHGDDDLVGVRGGEGREGRGD